MSMQFSNEGVRAFGKPGRPSNDPVRERLRIYRAVRPVIMARGVRGATIKELARAACLSPGGIYHYFGTKEQLILHGLSAEGLSRACMEEAAELYELLRAQPDVDAVIGLFVEKNVRMLEFVRPALCAAVELGRPELRRHLSAGLKEDADSLVATLSMLGCSSALPEELARTIRRTIFGLAIDEEVHAAEARRHLSWLFTRVIPPYGGLHAAPTGFGMRA